METQEPSPYAVRFFIVTLALGQTICARCCPKVKVLDGATQFPVFAARAGAAVAPSAVATGRWTAALKAHRGILDHPKPPEH